MKKRIAILYSGGMRANGLNPDYNADNIILNATNDFFLNKEFKEKYNYDVFFSTDVIDIDKAINFYGNHLKNIHIDEKKWCLYPIDKKLPEYSYFYDKYIERTPFNSFDTHIHTVHQFYRMYWVYNLAKDYEIKNNLHYDYFIRIRPDSRLTQNLMPLFDLIEKYNIKIFLEHEHICVIHNEFEEFFNFVDYFGHFYEPADLSHILYTVYMVPILYNKIFTFCPERQLYEYIYYIVKKKGQNFKDVFRRLIYPTYNLLYRGKGIYGSTSHKEGDVFKPYHSFDTIKYCIENGLNL